MRKGGERHAAVTRLPFPILQRSPVSGLRQTKKQKEVGVKRVETIGVYPLAPAGTSPRPAAGQEGRHQGFYPLNSHFLLFRSPAQTRDRRPLRKGERQSGYHSVSFVKYSQFADSVLLHMSATLRRARHNRVAQFLGTLYRKAPANLSVWHNLSSRVLSVITR